MSATIALRLPRILHFTINLMLVILLLPGKNTCILASQVPRITNEEYNITADIPFIITWSDTVGAGVTIDLLELTGDKAIMFKETITTGVHRDDHHVWTPPSHLSPADTYMFGIIDEGTDEFGYSSTFNILGGMLPDLKVRAVNSTLSNGTDSDPTVSVTVTSEFMFPPETDGPPQTTTSSPPPVAQQSSSTSTSTSTSEASFRTLKSSTRPAASPQSTSNNENENGKENQTNNTDNNLSGLSTGAKAGIGVGAAAGGLVLLAGVIYLIRSRRNNTTNNHPVGDTRATGMYAVDDNDGTGQAPAISVDRGTTQIQPFSQGDR